MYGYNGISKRFVEGLYAGSYRPNENSIEMRCSFWKRYLGLEHINIPNVGFYNKKGKKIARPLIIATDLLDGKLDTSGNQIEGESDGLYYTNLPNEHQLEPTLAPLRLLLERIKKEKLLTFFPGDQHENPSLFDLNALSTTILDNDLTLLSAREKQIIQNRYMNWLGKRLPLGIWKDIFMKRSNENPKGELIGKEQRNFLQHCTEYVVEYIPKVLELFELQRKELETNITQTGNLVPTAYWFPIAKDGLMVDLPGDKRGLGGNKFDELLIAAFTGNYFQGDDHRHQKRAIIIGAVSEYSVRLAIEPLIDANIHVI